MSQKHLYGDTLTQMNPPIDWDVANITLTFEDKINTAQTEFAASEFVFTNQVADWIESYHIPTYGVFYGVRYRVESIDDFTGDSTVIFDGFIDLSKRTIQSKEPNIFTAPIVKLDDIATVLEQVFVYTQYLLEQQGFINSSDFVDVPVIRESKKNVAERAIILANLLSEVVSFFTKAIQNFMSALSDILGISLPLGLVEMLLLFVNAVIEVNMLIDSVTKTKDLFFPAIYYYKGIKLKSILTKAFEKLGYEVDFGVIDEVLSKIVLLGSQDNNDGFPFPGFPVSGILKTQDYGYLVGEALETVQNLFNTRAEIRDGVVQIRNEFDPFWTNAPSFSTGNILLDTTDQYSNGYIQENSADIKSVVSIGYKYDESDAHTLTEKNGDYAVVRRSLITEGDPKLNLLKGYDEITINYAIAVRKKPLDNLEDLFMGITEEFDKFLTEFKELIEDYLDDIPDGAGVGDLVDEILEIPYLSTILSDREGALKIDDNTFAIPKLIYLEGGKIPENFKDIIGAQALYDNYYKQGSPADVSGFNGQKINLEDWTIPFTVDRYNLVKNNPYFNSGERFKSINWIDDKREAVTSSEKRQIFDTNITEENE